MKTMNSEKTMKIKTQWLAVLVITGSLASFQTRAQCCGHHGAAWQTGGCQDHLSQAVHHQGTGCPAGGCWAVSGQYGRIYDPKTVKTVAGDVESVERFTPQGVSTSGVRLLLKTEGETFLVHLGPSWYVDNQEEQIQSKDKVQITGSLVTLDGKQVLIAAEVTKGNGTLKLRDANGVPLWAAWRSRR